MTEQIVKCCGNPSKYLIKFKIGSKFYVCENCASEGVWSRAIKEKTTIDNSSNKHFPQELEESMIQGADTC